MKDFIYLVYDEVNEEPIGGYTTYWKARCAVRDFVEKTYTETQLRWFAEDFSYNNGDDLLNAIRESNQFDEDFDIYISKCYLDKNIK